MTSKTEQESRVLKSADSAVKNSTVIAVTQPQVEAALAVLAEAVQELRCGQDPDSIVYRTTQALATLTAALAARERDAARYRWIERNAEITFRDEQSWPAAQAGAFIYSRMPAAKELGLAVDLAIESTTKDAP